MLKDTLTGVYYSFPSCYGSGHMMDPSIDANNTCMKGAYRRRNYCSTIVPGSGHFQLPDFAVMDKG